MGSTRGKYSDPLHRSLLGSNSLRGGPKEFGPRTLCGPWYEARHEPGYSRQCEDFRRRTEEAKLRNPGATTLPAGEESRYRLMRFNEGGRSDLKSLMKPMKQVFLHWDPDGIPEDSTVCNEWDTTYESSFSKHPRSLRREPWETRDFTPQFGYDQYEPERHWVTETMTAYRGPDRHSADLPPPAFMELPLASRRSRSTQTPERNAVGFNDSQRRDGIVAVPDRLNPRCCSSNSPATAEQIRV